MHLSEQDKSDLLSLLSGLGTSDSMERARRLVDDNPLAAQYLQQMRLVADAFHPSRAEPPDTVLSPQRADELAQTVLARVAKPARPSAAKRPLPPLWRRSAVGAAAAVVFVAFCGTWLALVASRDDGPKTLGTVVQVPQGYAGANPYEDGEIVPGRVVTTRSDALARLEMTNGFFVVLEPAGSMLIGEDGTSFTLREGAVRISTETTATLYVLDTKLTLRNGVGQFQVNESTVSCYVFAGSATLMTPAESRELEAGQVARWNQQEQSLRIRTMSTPNPPWVTEFLKNQTGQEPISGKR